MLIYCGCPDPTGFTGGGYVLPLTPGHLEFCWQIKQTVRQHGPDIAILVVQYTLAPQTVYPEQVKQSVEAVRYVMSTLGKRSSDIILGGDSAGGTLALDVVIHAQHPHPSIAPLTPATPYRGLLLISPWVDFSINNESWKRNGDKDICTAAAFKTWSEAYLGSMPSDNYSEPCRATTEYFERVQARKILVTAGQEEVLVDAVTALANQIKVRLLRLTFGYMAKTCLSNGRHPILILNWLWAMANAMSLLYPVSIWGIPRKGSRVWQ